MVAAEIDRIGKVVYRIIVGAAAVRVAVGIAVAVTIAIVVVNFAAG